MTDEQFELQDLMTDISQRCWCAGWMLGIEHDLWDLLETNGGDLGMGYVSLEEADKLRALSKKLGGWVAWMEQEERGNPDELAMGETFLPLDAWKARHAAWEAKKPPA